MLHFEGYYVVFQRPTTTVATTIQKRSELWRFVCCALKNIDCSNPVSPTQSNPICSVSHTVKSNLLCLPHSQIQFALSPTQSNPICSVSHTVKSNLLCLPHSLIQFALSPTQSNPICSVSHTVKSNLLCLPHSQIQFALSFGRLVWHH